MANAQAVSNYPCEKEGCCLSAKSPNMSPISQQQKFHLTLCWKRQKFCNVCSSNHSNEALSAGFRV
eukprot:1877272-Amphidinium_carterae.1